VIQPDARRHHVAALNELRIDSATCDELFDYNWFQTRYAGGR